ncbi:uncharacterized protein LOC110716886 [Chenopodium quinoa]|uniref:uncharacterized protein LOC110716886 n=1 Tax=Chenopodium quinoa TaxID=63459 RepID=UPI000B790354|nr:uncharacterized protein LOC110716886 [Chenopodium quinoa]
MARTKRTTRYTNSHGSSFYVPVSETSDQSPAVEGPQSGSVAASSEEGPKVVPSHFTVDLASRQLTPEEEEDSAPLGEGRSQTFLISAQLAEIEVERAVSLRGAELQIEIPHLRPTEYKRSRLPRNRRTVNRPYDGVLSGSAVRERLLQLVNQTPYYTTKSSYDWIMQDFLRDSTKVQQLVELFYHVVCAVDGIAGERVSMRVDLDCSNGRNTIGVFTHKSLSVRPSKPDLVEMAKSMIKVIPPEEKDTVKGVGTLDLDGIMGLLSETLLRVHGLRRPINAKNKEAQATSTIRAELEAAKKKNNELEQAVKSLKDELQPLKNIAHKAEGLQTSLDTLKERLEKQEAAITKDLNAKAEAEKMALAQAMMEDSAQIMKMTWTSLFPKAHYAAWDKKFNACTEEHNRMIMQQAVGEDEAADSNSEEEEEVVALQPIEVDVSKEAAPDAETSKKDASKNQASLVDQAAVNTEAPPQS